MGARSIEALVDSGADDSFIDATVAEHTGILLMALAQSKQVQDLDGRPLPGVSPRTHSSCLSNCALDFFTGLGDLFRGYQSHTQHGDHDGGGPIFQVRSLYSPTKAPLSDRDR